jgi:hypothetical protein
MKKLVLSICLAVVFHGMRAGIPALPVAAAIRGKLTGPPHPQALQHKGSVADNLDRPIEASGLPCAEPTPDTLGRCQELEQRILDSTVRIEWDVWVSKDNGDGYSRMDRIGHATVKEGRYLVTHNHGRILQSDLKNNEWNRISVFAANGRLIWPRAPLYTISIAAQDAETLVLDFGDYGGPGLFAIMGLSSAEFQDWGALPLQPGMEVAQVIWDGETASVAWVTIDEIVTDNGTPRLELDSTVAAGTSGGGVFWNGYHVANTWSQTSVLNVSDGTVARRYSVAALNSPQVAAADPATSCGSRPAPTLTAQPPDPRFC